MSGYQNVFGGSTVQPTNVQLQQITLSASIVTVWPQYATTQQPLARIMEVNPTVGSLSISLPDTTLTGVGQDVLFDNNGANSFTVLDYAGGVIATVAPGTVWYMYLAANATQAGTWRVTQFGAATSQAQASALSGSGLKAIGAVMAQAIAGATFTSSFTAQTSDRAKLYISTGASLTVTLPLSSVTGNDFFFELRNQGSGILTIAPTGGETIDGLSTIVLQINESCHVHATTGAWYTVGRGRNQAFNFTQLTKTLTGGSYSLTLNEASNVVQTYTGTLTSNQTIVLPAVVQVYYITNNLAGGYTLTLKSPVVGNTITLPYGQSAVVFCDATNVVNASNTTSGFTGVMLTAGTAASPSLSFVASNNGMYAPTSTTVAVAPGGSEAVRWSSGQTLVPNGSLALPSYSFTVSNTTGLYSPSTNTLALVANGTAGLTMGTAGQVSLTNGAVGTPALNLGDAATGFYRPALNQVAMTINGTQIELNASTGKTLAGNLVFGTGVTFPANMTQAQLQGVIGTLPVSSGGTGVATLTGVAFGNGTGAFTAATGAQIASAIGSTAVTNATNATSATSATTATNLAGSTQYAIPYQSAAGATGYLNPGTAGQALVSGGVGGAPSWASVAVPQIQPIGASVASNNLTVTTSALQLDFRSTTLGSGTVTTVAGTPASITALNGASFGGISGVQQDLYVLVLNNAGTLELALTAGVGLDLTETGLISTTAISAAATSPSVVYSNTARTNVAFRVIGLVRSTQATAGTWATSPSLIQGYGGQALAMMNGLGVNQTWQSVVRNTGTTYYNTTGRAISMSVGLQVNGTGGGPYLTINGNNVYFGYAFVTGGNYYGGGTIIIPAGAAYILNMSGSASIYNIYELR